MDLLKKKIKGASILESLVAMAIILLALTLSTVIYSSITTNKFGMRTLFFENECERIFFQTAKAQELTDKTITSENYIYQIHFSEYMNCKKLNLINIKVLNAETQKHLYEFNRLLTLKTDSVFKNTLY